MDVNKIIRIMQAVSENGLTSFELEEGDLKISMKKECPQLKIMEAKTTGQDMVSYDVNDGQQEIQRQESRVCSADVSANPELNFDKVITSPLIGTFYNSASPDLEPFVKVGDTVKKGQVLGIIEAMKLMNEIESEFDGVVGAILVSNEDVVEFGQPLFHIR